MQPLPRPPRPGHRLPADRQLPAAARQPPRALATWLSPGDAVRLVDACLRAPDLGFAIVYGISANTRGWWDLSTARALGYEPVRTTPRRTRAEIEVDAGDRRPTTSTRRFLGGSFTRL